MKNPEKNQVASYDPWFPDPAISESRRPPHVGTLSAFYLFLPIPAGIVGVFGMLPFLLVAPFVAPFGFPWLLFAILWPLLAFIAIYLPWLFASAEFCARVRLLLVSPRFGSSVAAPATILMCAALTGTAATILAAVAMVRVIARFHLTIEDMSLLIGSTCYSGYFLIAGTAAVLIRTMKQIREMNDFAWQDPPSRVKCSDPILIAHLSDLHLEASPEAKPNQTYRRLVAECRDSLSMADVLLITGDITNTGESGQWEQFFAGMTVTPNCCAGRTVIVPGNHDLNFIDPSNYFRVMGDGDPISRSLRKVRFLYAINRVQGDRSSIVLANGGLSSFREVFDAAASDLERFRSNPPERSILEGARVPVDLTSEEDRRVLASPEVLWDRVCPLVVECSPSSGKRVMAVVIDSNAPSSSIATNAFGRISKSQLRRLGPLVRRLESENETFFLTMHHHMGRPVVYRSLAQRIDDRERFLGLENPGELIDAISGVKRHVLFHGHRHLLFERLLVRGELSVHVVSAPSSTLGDPAQIYREKEVGVGFQLFAMAHEPGRGPSIVSHSDQFVAVA